MIFSKSLDIFLIKFPILFLFTYLLLLFLFPEKEQLTSLLVMLFFAEPHFGATWTLFSDKNLRSYAKKRKFEFVFMTSFIVLCSILVFMINKNIFYLFFFLFNAWHVTKQSIGICKLFSKDLLEIRYQSIAINTINLFIIFFGAILYLSLGILSFDTSKNLGILIGSFIALLFLYQIFRFKNLENALTTLTGLIIFLPSFFVMKPIHALLAGVTMHYSQYLSITFRVYLNKNKIRLFQNNYLGFFKHTISYLRLIIIYGFLATFLTSISQDSEGFYANLIIVPIIGQIIHFYIDGLIWKAGDKNIRKINFKYILSS